MTSQGQTGAASRFSLFDLGFAALFVLASGWFLIWGLDYTNYTQVTIFVLATLFGLFMAFNIGGNDVANSFGTSVGAGTITIKQALAIAAIFEVSGAVIAGGEVTDTIRKGIVDLGAMDVAPMQFVYIMMAALLAAALWLLFASKRGWPVSTTHSIIGGIVGASIALGIMLSGGEAALGLVHWDQVGLIALSWVLSPLLGGLVSYGLFHLIKTHILQYNDRMKAELARIHSERRQLRDEHKSAFERMSDIQKVSYTHMMVRDSEALEEEGFTAEDLETDYYRRLHELRGRKSSLAANRALQNWVPLVAAGGAAVISSMLLFKGLKNMELGLSTLNTYLIMAMIAAGVWMATYIFARTLRGESLDRSTFLIDGAGRIAREWRKCHRPVRRHPRRAADQCDRRIRCSPGPGDDRLRYRAGRGLVVHRQGGHQDRRPQPHPDAPGLGLCRRAGRGHGGHAGLDAGPAGIEHAYPDRRGAGHRPRQQADQLGADEADRGRLGDHAARSGPAGGGHLHGARRDFLAFVALTSNRHQPAPPPDLPRYHPVWVAGRGSGPVPHLFQ